MSSAYDNIAGLYDRFWRDWYLPAALPALDRLFFRKVALPAQVLDVCCGCGHVTAELVRRGYLVTGIDISSNLIALARQNVPAARFLVQDVRSLQLPQQFDAALSTFDSLNHLLSLEELAQAFRSVRRALSTGGLFVFDMNAEEAFTLDLHDWNVQAEQNELSLLRGTFDPISKIADTELIWFRRTQGELWERQTSLVRERCYAPQDIQDALAASGFREVNLISAPEAGMSATLGFGRIMLSAIAS